MKTGDQTKTIGKNTIRGTTWWVVFTRVFIDIFNHFNDRWNFVHVATFRHRSLMTQTSSEATRLTTPRRKRRWVIWGRSLRSRSCTSASWRRRPSSVESSSLKFWLKFRSDVMQISHLSVSPTRLAKDNWPKNISQSTGSNPTSTKGCHKWLHDIHHNGLIVPLGTRCKIMAYLVSWCHREYHNWSSTWIPS